MNWRLGRTQKISLIVYHLWKAGRGVIVCVCVCRFSLHGNSATENEAYPDTTDYLNLPSSAFTSSFPLSSLLCLGGRPLKACAVDSVAPGGVSAPHSCRSIVSSLEVVQRPREKGGTEPSVSIRVEKRVVCVHMCVLVSVCVCVCACRVRKIKNGYCFPSFHHPPMSQGGQFGFEEESPPHILPP